MIHLLLGRCPSLFLMFVPTRYEQEPPGNWHRDSLARAIAAFSTGKGLTDGPDRPVAERGSLVGQR